MNRGFSVGWAGNKSVSSEFAFGKKTPMPRRCILTASERSALLALIKPPSHAQKNDFYPVGQRRFTEQ